jgi:preprotein translocase subunit SecD
MIDSPPPHRRRLSRRHLLVWTAAALLPNAASTAPQTDPSTDSFLWDVQVALDTKALGTRKRSPDDLKRLEEVLVRRIPIFTLAKDEGKVIVKSESDITIRIPADQVVEPQVAMLCRTGELELRHLEDLQTNLNPAGRYFLETVTVQGIETKTLTRFRDKRTNLPVPPERFLAQCPLIGTAADLEPDSAHRVGSGLQMSVRARFNEKVAKKLERFAGKPGRLLALVMDGQIISIHTLPAKMKQKGKRPPKESIDESGFGDVDILAGFGTEEEAQWLAVILNSGPLPLPIKAVSSKIHVPDGAKPAPGA